MIGVFWSSLSTLYSKPRAKTFVWIWYLDCNAKLTRVWNIFRINLMLIMDLQQTHEISIFLCVFCTQESQYAHHYCYVILLREKNKKEKSAPETTIILARLTIFFSFSSCAVAIDVSRWRDLHVVRLQFERIIGQRIVHLARLYPNPRGFWRCRLEFCVRTRHARFYRVYLYRV